MIETPIRLALWSGPRNLSTAMMRSFGARSDTVCIDEPFYAAYLTKTGLNHPMRDAILAAHENDADTVIQNIAYDPTSAPIYYQKHMCHHMMDGIDWDWMENVRHAFLIRHPMRVLASYAKKTEEVSLDAIGFEQQLAIFDHVTQNLGQKAIVIDSDDILKNPEKMLRLLCAAWDIIYQPEMLCWEKGSRPEDGVWASHWYGAVINSTGFGDAPDALPILSTEYAQIVDKGLQIYDKMSQFKLR